MLLRQAAALRVSAVNVGDIVVLKSGGPRMTVTEVGREKVRCKWFDEKKVLQNDFFVPGSLRLADDDKELGSVRSTRDPGYDPHES